MSLMYLYSYEAVKLNNAIFDRVREFCLCKKVEEEYVRSLIKRDFLRKRKHPENEKGSGSAVDRCCYT